MGSRKYTGTNNPKTLVTFLKALLCCINAVLLCAALTLLLVTGSQTTHAQSGVTQRFTEAVPQNHQLPMSGRLGDNLEVDSGQYRARSTSPSAIRRTIPTLRARYRPQDGDLFGEGQANSNDSAGGSIFDQLEDGPQPPATKQPAQNNPFGEPNQRNPFGEPNTRTPFDPSPREPLMDTQREQPSLQARPEKRTPRQSGRDGAPQLPEGSEFTPDSGSIPELPMPSGGTRSTDKAGTMPPEQDTSPDLTMPEEEDLNDARNDFNEDLDGFDLVDPRDRSPRSDKSSRRRRSTTDRDQKDWRPRNRGSNVYRPAREPSYYSRPTEAYGQYPAGYGAADAYASQPYAVPNAMEIIVQNAVQNAMRNYAANPANPAVAPYYGCGYACPPCPPGLQGPPSPELIAAYCGCSPQGAQKFPTDPELMLSQQFAQPSSSPSSPGLANDVYEGVVCGDQEIESYDPQCFPYKKSGFGIGGLSIGGGGLGVGGIRNTGPNVYYGSIFGGWTGLDDLMLSGDEGQIQISNDSGFAVGFAFGQIQGKNLRSEIEVTYRSNDLDGMTLNGLSGATQFLEGDGTIEATSGMLNVFWDFTDVRTRFKPYLGFGFGGVSADADFQIDGERTLGDGNDTSLAYQWIGGISYQTKLLSDFYVEYRYFAADSLHFNTTLPPSAIIDGDGELEYRTSNVVFGIRMKF